MIFIKLVQKTKQITQEKGGTYMPYNISLSVIIQRHFKIFLFVIEAIFIN